MATVYIFHRSDGFYPLELEGGDASAIANAEHNPGTIKVERALSKKIVWMDHSYLVSVLKKTGQTLLAEWTPEKADLNHMAVGVCGEAGELSDAIKKFTHYNKPLDLENVIEELGDLEFFMAGIRQALGIRRETTIAHNTAKLLKRYEAGSFSNAQAQARADKQ